MRNGKSLVQIEVTNISPNLARIGEPDLCIHIGAIHVYLPPIRVNRLCDFEDVLLKHPMRRGVSDHERRQTVCVLSCLFF